MHNIYRHILTSRYEAAASTRSPTISTPTHFENNKLNLGSEHAAGKIKVLKNMQSVVCNCNPCSQSRPIHFKNNKLGLDSEHASPLEKKIRTKCPYKTSTLCPIPGWSLHPGESLELYQPCHPGGGVSRHKTCSTPQKYIQYLIFNENCDM